MPTIEFTRDDIEDLIRENWGEGDVVWKRGKSIRLIQSRFQATRPIGFRTVGDDTPEQLTTEDIEACQNQK